MPPDYIDAWRQLHYAAQVVSEIGKSWATPQPDDSHSNLGWFNNATVVGFDSVTSTTTPAFAACVHTRSLTIKLLHEDGSIAATCPLHGHTLADAMAWLNTEATKLGGPRLQPSKPAPDLPHHPLADGAKFDADHQAALSGIAALYSNTDVALESLRAHLPNCSDARTWPHHFDHAALSVVQTDDADEMTATIGIGLTPPDGLNQAGYWYVSPWRKNGGGSMTWETLPSGKWIERSQSPPIAVLSLTDVTKATDQQITVAEFVANAASQCLMNLTSG